MRTFSVPVTVILSKRTVAPRSRFARASTYPPSRRMSAPRARNPFKCWSMGRAPMAHPPGKRHPGPAEPAEQRPEHQHRRPHLPDQVVRCLRHHVGRGMHPDHVALGARDPLGVDAHRPEQLEQGGDVGEVRDVAQGRRALAEEGRGHQGQGGVLAARDAHLALEPDAAFNVDLVQGLASPGFVSAGPRRCVPRASRSCRARSRSMRTEPYPALSSKDWTAGPCRSPISIARSPPGTSQRGAPAMIRRTTSSPSPPRRARGRFPPHLGREGGDLPAGDVRRVGDDGVEGWLGLRPGANRSPARTSTRSRGPERRGVGPGHLGRLERSSVATTRASGRSSSEGDRRRIPSRRRGRAAGARGPRGAPGGRPPPGAQSRGGG